MVSLTVYKLKLNLMLHNIFRPSIDKMKKPPILSSAYNSSWTERIEHLSKENQECGGGVFS